MTTCIVLSHRHMKKSTPWCQFLHVRIITHKASFQVLYHKEWISAWNSDQRPRFVLTNKFFQQISITGLQNVLSTDFEYGQIHHNLRINFGTHHEVLHEFCHSSRCSEPIFHSSRSSGHFSKFSHPKESSD